MKILWITEFFPQSNAGEITGGVEARCFFVSKYLRQSGHQLQIISMVGGEWDYASFFSIPKRIFFMIKAVLAGLSVDFDIVEGSNFVTHMVAKFLGTIRHKPVVFWYPDVYIGKWVENVGLSGILGEILERRNLQTPPDKYIAISNSTKSKLISSGVHGEKIAVIYCGIEPEEIKKIPHKKKQFDICSVNRLVGYKRTNDLIQALAILKKTLPNISLAIVGQGPERKNLQKLTDQLNLKKNIHFLGHLKKHSEVLEVMTKSKIFCLSSTVEGFGIVLVESASLKTPYVASDIPVIKEITQQGTGGLLFEPKNVPDLAEKILFLLTNHKEYLKKQKESIYLAKNYSWEKIAQQTEKLYENLLTH